MRMRSFVATFVLVAGLHPVVGCQPNPDDAMNSIKIEADAKVVEKGLKFKDTVVGMGSKPSPACPSRSTTPACSCPMAKI